MIVCSPAPSAAQAPVDVPKGLEAYECRNVVVDLHNPVSGEHRTLRSVFGILISRSKGLYEWYGLSPNINDLDLLAHMGKFRIVGGKFALKTNPIPRGDGADVMLDPNGDQKITYRSSHFIRGAYGGTALNTMSFSQVCPRVSKMTIFDGGA